jgi:hypothetical protein
MNNFNDYLQHHGIKGMKWGVRRFFNKNRDSNKNKKLRSERSKKISRKIAKGAMYLGASLAIGILGAYGARKATPYVSKKFFKSDDNIDDLIANSGPVIIRKSDGKIIEDL